MLQGVEAGPFDAKYAPHFQLTIKDRKFSSDSSDSKSESGKLQWNTLNYILYVVLLINIGFHWLRSNGICDCLAMSQIQKIYWVLK